MEPDRRTPPTRPGAAAPEPAGDGPRGDESRSRRLDRVEAVRRAVDQAVTATAGAPRSTRARAQELADELGSVVTRVRGTLEELSAAGTTQAGALADELGQAVGRLGRTLDDVRPGGNDEVRRLTERVAALEERLARLEGGPGDRPASTDG